MVKCYECHKNLSYRKVLKSFVFNYKNIECTNCNTTQEPALRNRYLIALIIFVGLLTGAILADYLVDSGYTSLPEWLVSVTINLVLSFGLFFTIIPFMKFNKIETKSSNL